MSLRSWLSRRLSRFFRWVWLAEAPLWRPLADEPARREHGRPPRRPRRRLQLEGCEPRITTNDLWGVLQTGCAVGEVALLSGIFTTPFEAVLAGWSGKRRLLGPSAVHWPADPTNSRPAEGVDPARLFTGVFETFVGPGAPDQAGHSQASSPVFTGALSGGPSAEPFDDLFGDLGSAPGGDVGRPRPGGVPADR